MKTGHQSRTADALAAVRAAYLLYERPVVFQDPFAIYLASFPWQIVNKSRVLHWLVAQKFISFFDRDV